MPKLANGKTNKNNETHDTISILKRRLKNLMRVIKNKL